METLNKYKDVIIGALTKDGKVIIEEGRRIVIEVIKDVVKVVVDGIHALGGGQVVSYSSNEVVDSENSPAGEKMKEIWEKVKKAFQGLGEKIAAAAKRFAEIMAGLGTKIKEATAEVRAKIAKAAKRVGDKVLKQVIETFNKYKEVIIGALTKDGKVIIEEGRRIVIEVIKDVVKVVVDGIKALGGGSSNEVEVEYGFKEIWEKVVAAVKAYVGKFKKDVEAMVAKYMPRIIEALKKFKHVVIDEGKQLVIDMLGDIIKIVIKGGFGYELEEAQPNGFKEIWGKVVAAVKSYTGPLKEDLKKLVIKYKPRILEELQKFKKVVIEEGKGLVVEMLGDASKS